MDVAWANRFNIMYMYTPTVDNKSWTEQGAEYVFLYIYYISLEI